MQECYCLPCRLALSVHGSLVPLEVTLPSKRQSTNVTREGLLPCVQAHVDLYVVSLSGRIRTQGALEWPLPRVNPHMLNQIEVGASHVLAQVTPEDVFASPLP